jgi:hypothetical protein
VRDYKDALGKDQDRADVVDILAKNTTVKQAALYGRMTMPGLNPDGAVIWRA